MKQWQNEESLKSVRRIFNHFAKTASCTQYVLILRQQFAYGLKTVLRFLIIVLKWHRSLGMSLFPAMSDLLFRVFATY